MGTPNIALQMKLESQQQLKKKKKGVVVFKQLHLIPTALCPYMSVEQVGVSRELKACQLDPQEGDGPNNHRKHRLKHGRQEGEEVFSTDYHTKRQSLLISSVAFYGKG